MALLVGLALLLSIPHEAEALKSSRREAVRKRIQTVKTWQMSQELELDEEQAKTFFPVMEAYEDHRDLLSEERAEVELDLDSLLAIGDERSDREILKKLERLKLIDREQAAQEDEYQRRIGRILTPHQQARYELFERNFQVKLRRLIREIQEEDEGRAPAESGRKVRPEKRDESKRDVKSTQSKSRTGDKDKDESGSKKNSEERSSRGKRDSRNFKKGTSGPELPLRGESR